MSRSSADRASRFAQMSADRAGASVEAAPTGPSFATILGSIYGGEFRATDPGIIMSGTDVSTWPDMAGNGDLTGAGAARAVYDATGFNGHPCIKGNGTSSDLRATLSTPIANLSRPYHWAVCEVQTLLGSRYPINLLDAIPNGPGYLTFSFDTAQIRTDMGCTVSAELIVSAVPAVVGVRMLLEAGMVTNHIAGLVVNGVPADGANTGQCNGALTRLAMFGLAGSLFSSLKIAHYIYAKDEPTTQQRTDMRAAFRDSFFDYGLPP